MWRTNQQYCDGISLWSPNKMLAAHHWCTYTITMKRDKNNTLLVIMYSTIFKKVRILIL